ncbi:MAG: tRNA uridine-5-carboxymethylaminomethyl(34) synthesis GTPase MnmE [Candidatus Izemoplasmatales bacterium]|jgi:tRNA modification GTPase|nr:tRNA uridine-5-carboxymethylaminomethyl(34) synthesis GTPase MnmE [Candidatus Izemoplasmatales bacterium]
MIFDTIVGISTKLGESAVSVVRISGEDSISIADKIFRGKDLKSVQSHSTHYGTIVDGDEMIDEVMVTIFLNPRSFTTEDTVEITCHGGYLIANEIVKLLLINGARLATNGEFTRRAYLNGRIDLTKAESIMDMISAKTRTQLQVATFALKGDIFSLVKDLQDDLLNIIAQIEVNIDYPEYDDAIVITKEIIKPKIEELLAKINTTIKHSSTGKIIREGIKTVIIGRPNVGKSSLLNSLLKEDKAIVTEISGTTRDLIEAELNLSGIILKLIDTAGIRETEDIVEKIGIEKTKKAIEEAALVLLVLDQSQSLTILDKELLDLTKSKPRILIGNKMDLGKIIDIQGESIIPISAKDKVGLELIENEVKKLFIDESLIDNHETILSNTRHISKLEETKKNLEDALQATLELLPVDMIEIDLKNAWHNLGEITGDIASDTLIQTLFSRFCLGK